MSWLGAGMQPSDGTGRSFEYACNQVEAPVFFWGLVFNVAGLH